MLKKLIMLCLVSIFSTTTYAKDFYDLDNIKSILRPYMVKFIGKKETNKLIGPAPFSLKIPLIPELSAKAYDIKNIVKVKNDVVLSKKNKEKYDYLFIKELLKVVRNKKVLDKDINSWLSILLQGGSREGIYRAIVLDNTYKRLENFDRPLNEKVIFFSKDFFQVYLNKKVSDNELEKIDFYSLKRFMVEKSLEAIDALYLKNKDGVYAWYSILSQDLALKYSSIFNNRMRKETDLKKQYIWSKSVPLQHLKSEIILKLHVLLNSFQQI